jgi:MFS family permease
MLNRIWATSAKYPSQFWLLVIGLFISTVGTSMIWPFMTIYVSERLDIPLTEVAGIITLNGLIALFASFIAGPFTDRFGRKWIMVFSLVGNGLTYLLLSQAGTFVTITTLMALRGLFQPLYRVATNAMVSDIIPPENRADAFAIVRTGHNAGLAIGPAIGGFVVVNSYTTSFIAAAVALVTYGLLIAFLARETLPSTNDLELQASPQASNNGKGYGHILRDKQFLSFLFSFTLFRICTAMLWILLAVYAKQNYQVLESQYGLMQMTNAIMVVLFQVGVTSVTKRYLPLPVLALGTLVYALGVGSIAFGQGFWGFWMSLVVITMGELMIMPTSSTFVADLAPVEMRGRYMAAFAFAPGVGRSIAPMIGGLLNDNIGPRAIWIGGGLIGLTSALSYGLRSRKFSPRKKSSQTAEADP